MAYYSYNVQEWNEILYGGDNRQLPNTPSKIREVFNEIGAISSHVPRQWEDDVIVFIRQVQGELKNDITFVQIKEKYCILTVYYDYLNKEAAARVQELRQECINKLITKGVHPPTLGDNNG